MKKIILPILITISTLSFAQGKIVPQNNYQNEFANAYLLYPDIPKGVLEAVAFTMTRFHHIQNPEGSCVGVPKTYGVMGLTLDGQNYFRNNLNYIAQISGISVNDILQDPQQNILAFAAAYHYQLTLLNPFQFKSKNIAHVLTQLSELPDNGLQQNYALNTHLYSVLSFMNDAKMQVAYGFSNYKLDLSKAFGVENLKILSSKKIMITNQNVEGDDGLLYKKGPNNKSADYPPALSSITTCNFSSRGTAITAVTIHTIQGTYAGAISWANNCTAGVSYHYVLRSSDGQVTQVVLEVNKAWHVGSENPYTIGLEHEGYINDSTWYTAAMYQSSADLVRDITQSGYGINPLRTAYFPWAPTTFYNASSIPGSCVRIKGHMHFPNQSHTDPGSNWDWKYYDNLINNTTPVTTITNAAGTVTDNGGSLGNYTGERGLTLIQPTAASSITLTTIAFDLENTWDYLYIYDGATTASPLIGYYTGTSIPSTITSSGGSLLLELRSDCATGTAGYEFNYTSVSPDLIKPTTTIAASPQPNATTSYTSNFTDLDNVGGSGVMHQFYQVSDYNTSLWRSNNNNGFFNDDFDGAIHADWIDSSGVWSIVNNKLNQVDEANSNTNIYAALNQNNSNKYLYHYKATISGSGITKRAGFHYMSDDASQTNRGNSYFVWFRQDDAAIQFFKVINNVFTMEKNVAYSFNAAQEYDYKIVYDKITGITEIYVDDIFVSSWQDSSPITVGNYVSFRSGNAIFDVNDFRTYHSRSLTEIVSVGVATTNDIRFENNPTTSGKIQSIAIDTAHNISLIAVEMVDVDFIITSINGVSSSLASIYPNPFVDKISINFNNSDQVNISLHDINGKTILNQNVMPINQTMELDLETYSLPQGVYILQVKSSQLSESYRLIKQ